MRTPFVFPLRLAIGAALDTVAAFAAAAAVIITLGAAPLPARAAAPDSVSPAPSVSSPPSPALQPAQPAPGSGRQAAVSAPPLKAGKLAPVKTRRTHPQQRRAGWRSSPGRRAGMSRIAFAPSRLAPPARMRAPEGLAIRSGIGLVVDQNTSEPLFDKHSQVAAPIASISKLMTAMVVLDANQPMTEQLTVTDKDRDSERNTGSRLSVGSVLTRAEMLHIALMSSENRAAAALSRYYPGGRPAFVAAMNQKAQALGMTRTHFEDPTGLTSRNVSTAQDLVKMVDAAYRYPLIRQFSTDRYHDVFTGRKTIHYLSTNTLVRRSDWTIGLQKTGFINEAGECLVMQAIIEERPVIIVLLNSSGKLSRFADARRVRHWLAAGGVQRVTSVDQKSRWASGVSS